MGCIPDCCALSIKKTSLEFPTANTAAMRTKALNLPSKYLSVSLGFAETGADAFFCSVIKKMINNTAMNPGIMESQKTIL